MELLAPAGDLDALRAALAVGADAVYFGLDRWSARAFAGNFTGHDVVKAIERAHLYGARAHLALNTLLKDDELRPALAALQGPYEAGLDALIVADLGFAALVRETYPDLELHASTQLNTHSSAQLAALAERGFARAILARELSLAEIERLDAHGLGLEVFVHGALCYGYSGSCLFSSMIGGRSGNRGRCSQSCRMRYRLLAGEQGTGLTRVLSTNDLAAIGALPRLLRAGVASFKIEGRMKDASYVAAATAVYREALDAAAADPDAYVVRPEWMSRLEQSFSRGFTNAYLDELPATVRSRGRGGHRGVAVGRVESVDDERGLATIRLAAPLHDNDVVSIYTPAGQTEPVRLGAVRERVGGASGAAASVRGQPPGAAEAGERVTLRLRERVSVKDRLFRLSSAEIDAFAQAAVAGRLLLRPRPLSARLEGRVGEPARLTMRSTEPGSVAVTVEGHEPLAPAKTAPLTLAKAHDALGALGGTPYALVELDYAVAEPAFLAVGALKELRRRALAELDERRLAERRREPAPRTVTRPGPGRAERATRGRGASVPARAVVRELPTVVRVTCAATGDLAPGVAAWCLDLAGGEQPGLVAAVADVLRARGGEVRCRPPEILFDDDVAWWRLVAALAWDAVYARHALHLETNAPAILEYPLQGLNAEAARRLRPQAVVASPEASLDEIAGLAGELAALDPATPVEAVVFARQQLLVSRDRLGVLEGLVPEPPAGEPAALSLVDGKGFVFRAAVDSRGTRIKNARVTNATAHLADLSAAGVATVIVDVADMNQGERDSFATHGVAGLASFAERDRATTGHLFRGVG